MIEAQVGQPVGVAEAAWQAVAGAGGMVARGLPGHQVGPRVARAEERLDPHGEDGGLLRHDLAAESSATGRVASSGGRAMLTARMPSPEPVAEGRRRAHE